LNLRQEYTVADKAIWIIVVSSIVGGLFYDPYLQPLSNWLFGSTPASFAVLGPRPPPSLREPTFEELERLLSEVVVEVASRTADNRIRQGSAVVIGRTLLLTACHIQKKIGEESAVVLIPDREPIPMHLAGAARDTDRCVFTTDRPMTRAIPGVRLISTLQSLEAIYAFGYPSDTPTLSAGVFRNVFIGEDGVRKIRTNARVAPGNSGGGLFDRYGNLIGIINSGNEDGRVSFALVVEDWWKRDD
jgi:S1-C subfamily serine protease